MRHWVEEMSVTDSRLFREMAELLCETEMAHGNRILVDLTTHQRRLNYNKKLEEARKIGDDKSAYCYLCLVHAIKDHPQAEYLLIHFP